MDKLRVLQQLKIITGELHASSKQHSEEIKKLERRLSEQMIYNPDFSISGSNFFEPEVSIETSLTDKFTHIDDLFKEIETKNIAPALAFRRETSMRSNLLGNSVADWGSGLAANETYGPFIDKNGLEFYFDFFWRTHMIQFYITGVSYPVLLVPIRGIISAKKNYKIEAGSVWIASNFITGTSEQLGYYTGLKLKGGTIDLSLMPTIKDGNIIAGNKSFINLHLDLDQNIVNRPSSEAGFDATEAVINLPQTIDMEFSISITKLKAGDANCIVFGCDTGFKFEGAKPSWQPLLQQILIPYTVQTGNDDPENFTINKSSSKLNTLSSSAVITKMSGWLLPAAKIDVMHLGNAAGSGSLCINLKKGLLDSWKGLKGGTATLINPCIICEPGMVSVIDFGADNVYGKQKFTLWKNNGAHHHSEINITLGSFFPLVYISNSNGSEIVTFFCNFNAALDKPVASNGIPFKISSPVALAMISQKGKIFRTLLLDTNLWFNIKMDGSTYTNPEGYKKYSIALRNMFFNTTAPYSFFMSGFLKDNEQVSHGSVIIKFGLSMLLPTLPDPYVSNFNPGLRYRGKTNYSITNINYALAAFIKWPDQDSAHLNFEFSKYDHPYLPPPPDPKMMKHEGLIDASGYIQQKNFRATGKFFGGKILTQNNFSTEQNYLQQKNYLPANAPADDTKKVLSENISKVIESAFLFDYMDTIKQNALVNNSPDYSSAIQNAFDAARQVLDTFVSTNVGTKMFQSYVAADIPTPDNDILSSLKMNDLFTLLDVSSHADQMGVSFGEPLHVEQDERGDFNIRTQDTYLSSYANVAGLPFSISNMNVVSTGTRIRALTLPQISWEPLLNNPLEKKAPPGSEAVAGLLRSVIQFISDFTIASLPANPFAGFETVINIIVNGYLTVLQTPTDSITVLPGLMVYDNDGIPTKIASESPYLIPISPLPVLEHFLKEYNDKAHSKKLHASFTLPFGLVSKADFTGGEILDKQRLAPKISFNRPFFDNLHGGLQIKVLAPNSTTSKSKSLDGWTFQLNENIKWFLFGMPVTGSTLGETVRKIFNKEFQETGDQPKVPVEEIEISGYGASMFSNWLDADAAIAAVSQAKFDVLMGRTAHEVVQVRSILYPWGVHVVRTITLMRSPNGYVYRSDSGWKAESDGFYDFRYKVNNVTPNVDITDQPYTFHPGVVKGVSNVREIKDYPAAGIFTSSFKLNDAGLPPKIKAMTLAQWNQIFKSAKFTSINDTLKVEMQAVVFDADAHIENVKSGGVHDAVKKDYKVKSAKMIGYVQLAPSSVLVPSGVFAELLNFQTGSLGGPVDCIIDIANSNQRMRLTRVDVNPAKTSMGDNVFASAARGSLILPKDGSWSVVKHQTNTGDVKPVEAGQTVPLIKADNANPAIINNYRIANPSDVVVESASKINYGVLQSTGTQKLLFNSPQFTFNDTKLKSDNTYFADAYKLLNAKGVFPNIANALSLTANQKTVDILGEGVMKLLDAANKPFEIPLQNILPSAYEYEFINEPGIVRIYAQYKNESGGGNLSLGINSAATSLDKTWKAAVSNVCVCVDIGKDPSFKKVLYVDGDFNASAGKESKYGKPKLHFGGALQPMVDILQILATLTGNDFDSGMDVGMSNAPDSWEYKFNTSKEIPVIKFPTPEPPNTPMKIEAGLKVGFYFNEVLSLSSDLSTNVPACGAYIEFYAQLSVMCFSVSAASVYAVGQANVRITGDTKAGLILYMKFGFGVEIVVGYPVVGNAHVMFMAGVAMSLGTKSLDVAAFLLFKGSVEICGGLVTVCIQIEAQGIIHKEFGGDAPCYCTVQVMFSIDVCLLWVIDIDYHDQWSETRQIA